MTATNHTTILDAALVPFIQSTYPDNHRLFLDNDLKHTSHWVQWYFEENGIHWWLSPPDRPDINPIELIWGFMKETIRNSYKPRILQQLEDAMTLLEQSNDLSCMFLLH